MGVKLQLPDLRPVWGAFETLNIGTLRTSLTETFDHYLPFDGPRKLTDTAAQAVTIVCAG